MAMRAPSTPGPSGVRTRQPRHAVGGVLQAAAVTAALALTPVACSDGDSGKQADPGPSTSSRAADPTASESNADAGLVGAPEIGTCWQVPPVKAGDEEYRFDGSPQAPCTERHTTQTVAVYPLDKPTPKLASKEDRACAEEVLAFIGASDWVPVPGKFPMFLPSRDQVASGASWVRCDVAFASLTAGPRPVWRRGSAEEVLLRRPEEVWACLDKLPQQPTRPQPFVPCDQPHKYEATGHGLVLYLDTYPTPRKLRTAAAECQFDHRDPDYKGLTLQALWQPPNEVFGGNLLGSCWASRPDGQDLPPLR